jgi:hypothetical protein
LGTADPRRKTPFFPLMVSFLPLMVSFLPLVVSAFALRAI